MNLHALNPFVRYAREHCYFPQAMHFSQIYDCRLFFIQSGRGRLITKEREYHFSDQTAMYLPPESIYQWAFDQQDGIRVFVFDFDLTDQYSGLSASLGTAREENFRPENVPRYDLPTEFQSILIHRNAAPLGDRLRDSIEFFLRKTPYYAETSSANVKYCLIELLKTAAPQKESYRLVRDVLDYIHENCALTEMNNECIGALFNYHPYYLSSLIKQATGKSLHQYILFYRIQVAKNYLLTTGFDMEIIAWKCGFNSVSHFILIFRQQTGLTPAKYRHLYQRDV